MMSSPKHALLVTCRHAPHEWTTVPHSTPVVWWSANHNQSAAAAWTAEALMSITHTTPKTSPPTRMHLQFTWSLTDLISSPLLASIWHGVACIFHMCRQWLIVLVGEPIWKPVSEFCCWFRITKPETSKPVTVWHPWLLLMPPCVLNTLLSITHDVKTRC